MITIFKAKTSYTDAMQDNGAYMLDKIVISAETTEDIYGNYELNMELELQGDTPTELYSLIQVDSIIKVIDDGDVELFRIANLEAGLDMITIYARHITISDSLNLWLGNVKPTNLAGQAALDWLKAGTRPACNLLLKSNVDKVETADYVRKSLHEALTGNEANSFVNRWGGEIKRTGYTININTKIGEDKSQYIKIKEALNLTEFNGKSNIDDLVTVIYPIGFDGIQGPRVDSPLKGKYSMEYPREIKYEDIKVQKEGETDGYPTLEEAQAALRARAEKEFTVNHIDQIALECEVDYVDLEKFEEFAGLVGSQRINLGDYVSVRVETFSLDLKVRVVKRVYDVLRQRIVSSIISTTDKLKKPDSIRDIVNQELGGIKDQVVGDIEVGSYNYILNSETCLALNENIYKELDFKLEHGDETLKKLRGRNIVLSYEIEGDANFKSAGLKFTYQIQGEEPRTVECLGEVKTQYSGRNRLDFKFKLE